MTAASQMPGCPMCPGHGVLLGTLGAMRWFRCRDCGWDFARRRRTGREPAGKTTEGARDAPVRDPSRDRNAA